MKKSLIALAVMAAAGAASAQSSVQIYGIVDVNLNSTKLSDNDNGGQSQSKLDSGGVSTSRIGIKGTEDLGGGLKANFVLEKAISVDTGSADAGFDRQATVGLSGNFGQVDFGRQFTAYDDIHGTANNTFDANIGAIYTAWVGYTANFANTIKYTSPSFSGVQGAVSYSFGEDKNTSGNGKANNSYALNLTYANGPLFLGYAHQTENLGDTESSFGPALETMLYGTGWDYYMAGDKATYNLFTGSYDFGMAKLVGSYNQAKYTWNGYSDNDKAKEWQVGVEVPLASKMALGLGYAQSKMYYNGDYYLKTKGFSAALVYSLSKRTMAYAALNRTKETAENGYEAKLNVYAVGIKHSF